MQRTSFVLFPLLLGSLGLNAAPKLRLSATTVGPISVAQGANPAARSIEAYNAGDGNLSLQYASSAGWVSASTGGVRACSDRAGACLPINFAFNTASLGAGVQTATVTVSDPNALDAPQTVVVTVQVGGGVPARVSLFVPPNGAAEAGFSTNSSLTANATTQSGGPWLTLALEGTGSFRFVYPYRIRARHLDGMPQGTYNGQVSVSGSSVAAENHAVPVTLVVTTQPIAQAPDQVAFRVAQGAAAQQSQFTVGNSGQGALSVGTVSASATGGGSWLAAERGDGNVVIVKANPDGLAPGSYSGSVSIASNAANGTQNVPVRLDVAAQGAPVVNFDSVRNTAALDNELAPGALATLSGDQLTLKETLAVTDAPLPAELNGTRVLVNDQPAAMQLVSGSRIDFQVPFDVTPGEAVVRVERDGTRGNGVTVQVSPAAPRIVLSGGNEGGMIQNSDGALLVPGGTAAKPGDTITIFCAGLGATDVAVQVGTAAPMDEPLARVNPTPQVLFGSPFTGTTVADPIYAGLAPGLVGIYHVVAIVPEDSPQGDVFVRLIGPGYQSNRVIMPIRP